jgi:hypothetical protein
MAQYDRASLVRRRCERLELSCRAQCLATALYQGMTSVMVFRAPHYMGFSPCAFCLARSLMSRGITFRLRQGSSQAHKLVGGRASILRGKFVELFSTVASALYH